MQRKPIANKYRKGTMKSTLHSTYASYLYFDILTFCIQAPKGVKERVKSPYSEYYTITTQTEYRMFDNSVQLCLIVI